MSTRSDAALKVGLQVPDFEALTHDGKRVRLSDFLAKGPVVMFFYPKALTPGCSKECSHFRDLGAEFSALGATRLGISADAPGRQQEFVDRKDLDFALLCDEDRSIARAYGVARWGPLMNKRTTFVIASVGTLLDVIHNELNMDIHADRALDVLRAAGADS